jgi:hypothetical protein
LTEKKYRSAPKNAHVSDAPAQYLCIRRDRTTAWVPAAGPVLMEDLKHLRMFEWRFLRNTILPCNSVADYPVEKYSDESDWVSEDELDSGYEMELNL